MSEVSLQPLPSATALRAALERRELTASEAVRAHADRIDAAHGAFAVLDIDRALADAESLPAGPLYGVPVTVKEQIAVVGLPARDASLLVESVVADADAAVVARLRGAGAVVIGTTNMSEFAMFPDTTNRVYGDTPNPVDPSLSAGGSSGGEAVAVRSGASALGFGSDYGGSLRCPAHFCGIFGLRPGVGAVPSNGATGRLHTPVRALLSTVGPLARTADDLALAYGVISQTSAAQTSANGTLPARAARFDDARHRPVHPLCEAAVERTLVALADAGLEVDAVAPPFQTQAEDLFLELTAAETRAALGHLLPERLDEASPQLAAVWAAAQDAPPSSRDTELADVWARADAWFDRTPVLVAPAAAEPAYALGRVDDVFDLFAHCTLASALGLPALVVPTGLVGVQLIGKRGSEWQLLRLARLLEERLS
jgi:amidase